MGGCCSKQQAAPAHKPAAPPDARNHVNGGASRVKGDAAGAEEAAGVERPSALSTSSRHPLEQPSSVAAQQAPGFRHTSDLRVGVLEGKDASVTLLNDYIVLGGLGKGTYGSVKLCYNMLDDALYALKILQRAQLRRQMLGPRRAGGGSSHEQGALDMLRREVDVMRSMNHPNLIKIFEVIEHTSRVVLVQEYAEAGPLAQPDQLMSECLAQYYFRQIVAGLECLHAQSVVHGDMKPDNVLLSGSGLVKIADFGQAHFFEQGEDVFNKTLGTPAFMAPEMRSGAAYHGMPADMWALGVTLYAFLFGDVPFKGQTLDELYTAIQTREPAYPPDIPISPQLRSVLDGLLDKDPAKRPTAAQLMHHPWVAEEPERVGGPGLDVPLELERMNDEPSLENWVAEMALQDQASVSELPLVNEVAVSVFGRDIIAGNQELNVDTLMDAIVQDSANSAGEALLLQRSLTVPHASGERRALRRSRTSLVRSNSASMLALVPVEESLPLEDAAPEAASPRTQLRQWHSSQKDGPLSQQPSQQAAGGTEQEPLPAAGELEPAAGLQRDGGSDAPLAAAAAEAVAAESAAQQRALSLPGGAAGDGSPAAVEQVAATLNQLLENIGDGLKGMADEIGGGLATAGKALAAHSRRAVGEVAPFGRSKSAAFRADVAAAEQRAAQRRKEQLEAQQAQQAQQEQAAPFSQYQQPPAGPFSAPADAQEQVAAAYQPHLQRRRHAPVAIEQSMSEAALGGHGGHGAPVRAQTQPPPSPPKPSPLAMHRSSLPVPSPFESCGASDSAPVPGSLIRGISVAPSIGAPAGSSSKRGGLAAALGCTENVWEEMKAKTERNNVPGVRFVQFNAGQALDLPERALGNFCLLIEQGIVDIKYVARLKIEVPRSHVAGAGGSSSSGSSGSSGNGSDDDSGSGSGSDSEDEQRLERLDTLAREPEARTIGHRGKRGRRLKASDSLQSTVDRVLARAERLLGSASEPGEANLLTCVRGPSDFVGIAPMLDPVAYIKIAQHWSRHMVCRTEVTGALLSRAAVELLLKHYPLAQVYLRITLSKSRAEMLQLEALENIAACLAPSARHGPPADRGAGKVAGGPSAARLRLDLFQAVNFARRLAENMAERRVL